MAEPGLEIEYLLPSTKPGKSLMSCATKGTGVPRCVPRITQLLALALKLQGMLREGVVQDYAEIARLGHVSRSRVSQIMSLLQPGSGSTGRAVVCG